MMLMAAASQIVAVAGCSRSVSMRPSVSSSSSCSASPSVSGSVSGSPPGRLVSLARPSWQPPGSSHRRSRCTVCSATQSSQQLPPKPASLQAVRFCSACGAATELAIPQDEHNWRAVCTGCGRIHYQNPKMVVGCIVETEGKVLLVRRAIEPCYGMWTLPAGYMELHESSAEGAARETLEEACAHVRVTAPFMHLDIPHIGQAYIIFRASFVDPNFAAGTESLEAVLFDLSSIPFDKIAFSAVRVTLQQYVADVAAGHFGMHHGVIDKRPGAHPSDANGFVVRDLLLVPG
eukprot:jgi/Chlat1/4491/Chrsp29S04573